MTNIELDFYYADTEYFGHIPKNKGGQGCRLLGASEKTKVHGNSAHEPIPKGHTYSEQGSENEEAGTVDEQAEKTLVNTRRLSENTKTNAWETSRRQNLRPTISIDLKMKSNSESERAECATTRALRSLYKH